MFDTPSRHQRLIAQFTSRGMYATFRRWAMGETIYVCARQTSLEGNIRCFERAAYLIPCDAGYWQVYIELFDETPLPERAVVDRVVQLLVDDREYEHEMKRRRTLPENFRNSDAEE